VAPVKKADPVKAPAPVKAPLAASPKPSISVQTKKSGKPVVLQIPPILLEGDKPAPPPTSGPGQRYVLGPTPPAANPLAGGVELPESYGTGQLFLAARDPRWLYAHWDFASEQLKSANARSTDGHLLLRVYQNAIAGEPLSQIHLHPESRHWFAPAPFPGAKYLATLGYFDSAGNWFELARSGATLTPLENISEDTAVRFATIPVDVPFEKLFASVKSAVGEYASLAEAAAAAVRELPPEVFTPEPPPAAALPPIQFAALEPEPLTVPEPRPFTVPEPPPQPAAPPSETPAQPAARVLPLTEPSPSIPAPAQTLAFPATSKDSLCEAKPPPATWTPAQEKALAAVLSVDVHRRIWIGSVEITELIRRQMAQELSSIAAAQFGQPAPPALAPGEVGGISSPVSAPPESRGFWFNVNAELIIYGSTESDAAVTIGGRQIKLRPDGGFSFRFALPDGNYDLPVLATSSDGVETRGVKLDFSRQSQYHGHVEAHPQDAQLQPPVASAVS